LAIKEVRGQGQKIKFRPLTVQLSDVFLGWGTVRILP